MLEDVIMIVKVLIMKIRMILIKGKGKGHPITDDEGPTGGVEV
jgi:hypothetical protein